MSDRIDVAVVGVGYVGSLHAEKYASHPRARLCALVDPAHTARTVARRFGVPLVSDVAELPAGVRAASVAVPTRLHHSVGTRLLRAGVDVLIEKPIASSPEEADDLIAAAEASGRILQVGHLERFNPALRKLADRLRAPRFIESHRLAPFTPRGSDVDVVKDLMIHDIDIILDLVRSEPVSIRAAGVPVITPTVDIANARIEFADGCVANVTASRVSAEKLRKLRIFQPDVYVSLDFLRRAATLVRRVPSAAAAGAAPPARVGVDTIVGEDPLDLALLSYDIVREQLAFDDEGADPLALEIDDFLRAVRAREAPRVSGRDGRRALLVATRIVEQIAAGAGP